MELGADSVAPSGFTSIPLSAPIERTTRGCKSVKDDVSGSGTRSALKSSRGSKGSRRKLNARLGATPGLLTNRFRQLSAHRCEMSAKRSVIDHQIEYVKPKSSIRNVRSLSTQKRILES